MLSPPMSPLSHYTIIGWSSSTYCYIQFVCVLLMLARPICWYPFKRLVFALFCSRKRTQAGIIKRNIQRVALVINLWNSRKDLCPNPSESSGLYFENLAASYEPVPSKLSKSTSLKYAENASLYSWSSAFSILKPWRLKKSSISSSCSWFNLSFCRKA
jgi:hypothetical protein